MMPRLAAREMPATMAIGAARAARAVEWSVEAYAGKPLGVARVSAHFSRRPATAGDMAISNRQIVHGSFPNTSGDLRVTLGMGFHPYASVLGATGFSTQTGEPVTYDAERIRKRSEMIGYAIDARRHG